MKFLLIVLSTAVFFGTIWVTILFLVKIWPRKNFQSATNRSQRRLLRRTKSDHVSSALPVVALAAFLLAPQSVFAATTLTATPENAVAIDSTNAYYYLFSSDADATYLYSNPTPDTFPTNFFTGAPSDFCARFGDGSFVVVTVPAFEACNAGPRSACEADTGAELSPLNCVGGTLTIGGSAPVCGDNIVQSPEQCDDGGTADGDGCSSICETEGDLELISQDDFDNITVSAWRGAGPILIQGVGLALIAALGLGLLDKTVRDLRKHIGTDRKD